MTDKKFHLEIRSDPNNLIIVEEFVHYFGKELGLDDEQLSGLLLAVTEATTNAIIHGNKKDPAKKVEIDAELINKQLIVRIKDEGKGFDPAKIPDPTEPENILKDSGRGLYLIRVYMDDLSYKITPSGLETILTLNLS
ncbi:MAG: anti-sigma F factor [Ignavibacteriaceae bacterium]